MTHVIFGVNANTPDNDTLGYINLLSVTRFQIKKTIDTVIAKFRLSNNYDN